MYLWFKLLHIFFIISWFSGLFYLPRIYVNLAQIAEYNSNEYLRLLGMAKRLLKFVTPLGIGAVLSGLMVAKIAGWWHMGWLHTKVIMALLLSAYHFYCYRLFLTFQSCSNQRTHQWFRVFNEIPVVVMFIALYLVVFKPF